MSDPVPEKVFRHGSERDVRDSFRDKCIFRRIVKGKFERAVKGDFDGREGEFERS